jgi:hypothetical protein
MKRRTKLVYCVWGTYFFDQVKTCRDILKKEPQLYSVRFYFWDCLVIIHRQSFRDKIPRRFVKNQSFKHMLIKGKL